VTTAQGIGVLAGLTVVVLLATWAGWVRRGARTGALVPELPAVPGAEDLRRPAEAEMAVTYVSTTVGGSWLERVVAHGLGVRSAAVASVHPEGVLIARRGAPDLFIIAGAVHGVRLADGIAGKVVGGGRIVVIGWQHGAANLETGVLPRHASDRERLVTALTALSGPGPLPEKESA
jgi:hypothetical protein